MQKVWNIGNTTVRNPKRIEIALKVYFDEGFSGNAKGSENEMRLHSKLKESGVLEFDGEASDWNGRKWRAAFYQLGFVSYESYKIEGKTHEVNEIFQRLGSTISKPYELTPAGKKLINATNIPEIEEIYTRQFVCYELPNSLENSFPNEGKMKPLILFLQVSKLLTDASLSGLNKFETGLFIQKFRNHTSTLPNEIIQEIISYRDKLSRCTNSKEIKSLRATYLEELRSYAGIDPNSVVKDYADTTFRYFSLSGLFARQGDTLVIRNNKVEFVNQLLLNEPTFLYNSDPFLYFDKFYNNSTALPTDNPKIAINEIKFLAEGIRDKRNVLYKNANELDIKSDPEILRKTRYELIEYNNWEREEDFAREQQNTDNIKNIVSYLKTLNKEKADENVDIDDKPAFLEWAVWRSFLAINEIVNPIHQTRRFPLDQDFMPRNTAPGGGSDSIFEFGSYVLVVEVTLTTSHRQMAVESEPVRRHTVHYKELFPNKDVYCLFIAPSVDNNVAETFRIGIWYNLDEEESVNIVPMPLSDYISVFETLIHNKFKNSDFRNLLDRCLMSRQVRAPQWKKWISKEVGEWKRRQTA